MEKREQKTYSPCAFVPSLFLPHPGIWCNEMVLCCYFFMLLFWKERVWEGERRGHGGGLGCALSNLTWSILLKANAWWPWTILSADEWSLSALSFFFLFLAVFKGLHLFNPFSMSLRYCVPHIMSHMLFLWSVACTLRTRNGKWSHEVYFEGGTSSFMLLSLKDTEFS